MIHSVHTRLVFAGNNSSATPYPLNFPFASPDYVFVAKRLISTGEQTSMFAGTDYTIIGTDLRTIVALPSTYELLVTRWTTVTQPFDYVETSEFPAASHEAALDRLAMIAQENRDDTSKAFRLGFHHGSIPTLPAQRNSLVAFNAAGVPEMWDRNDLIAFLNIPGTVVNTPTKTWLNDAGRAVNVPDFIGQVGTQQDTRAMYVGTALTAGAWTLAGTSGGRTFLDTAARLVAVPEFIGQVASQRDTREIWIGTALSAGSWALGFDGGSEIAINAATTAIVGRRHVCSGGSYTVNLPAASTALGRHLEFRMAAGLTGIVTLDGNGSETINGALTRQMWAHEWVDLISDGAHWYKTGGLIIPHAARIRRFSPQSIPNAVVTAIDFETVDMNVGGMWDAVGGDLNIRRTGNYIIFAKAKLPGFDAGEYMEIRVTQNGNMIAKNSILQSGTNEAMIVWQSDFVPLVINDVIKAHVWHNEGGPQIFDTAPEVQPSLTVIEIPSW